MIASAAPAQQQNCAPMAAVVETLTGEKYSEVPFMSLPDGTGNTYRVWLNVETQTWTITYDNGTMMCLMKSGQGGTVGSDAQLQPTGLKV